MLKFDFFTRKNKVKIGELDLSDLLNQYQVDVYATTVIRGSTSSSMSGYAYRIDWNKKEIVSELLIPISNQHPFWNARGGNRGGRGVQVYNNHVYIATATSIYQCDLNLNIQREICNKLFGGLHEILVVEDGIWCTSTIHDLNIKVDFDGNIITEWFGGSDEVLMEYFNHSSRKLRLELDFDQNKFEAEYSNYVKDEIYHFNSISQHQNQLYTLSLKKGALIRFYPDTKVVLVDQNLKSPHNCTFTDNHVVVNNTKTQEVYVYSTETWELVRKINTNVTSSKSKSTQFASPGWQRGMRKLADNFILVGSSPACIFEVDFINGKIGKVMSLSDNVHDCIHGLDMKINKK